MNATKLLVLGMTLAVGAAVMVGCDGDPAPTTPPPPQPTAESGASVALPKALFLDQAPQEPVEVAEARKSVQPGQEVVVRGRIAGTEEPIADNRAMFTLLDAGVTTCEQMPDDACPTPWDACCEPRESLQAKTATVQVVDASGRPLEAGLRGVNGIEPLKEVVVVGTVRDGSSADNLIIDATGIHVKS